MSMSIGGLKKAFRIGGILLLDSSSDALVPYAAGFPAGGLVLLADVSSVVFPAPGTPMAGAFAR